MTDAVIEIITSLPRDRAIEAARFVASEIAGASDGRSQEVGAWAAGSPFTHIGDVETLSRLVLIARALSGAEGADSVERAIEGSGRKNLVLGGVEIVALAGIGVIALQLILTGGKLIETEITYSHDADGKPIITTRRTEKELPLSNALAAVLRPLFGLGRAEEQDK